MYPPELNVYLDHLPFAVAVLDSSNRVQYANDAARKILVTEDGPLVGRDLPLSSIEGDDRSSVLEAVASARAGSRATASFRYTNELGSAAMAQMVVQQIDRDGLLVVSILDQTDFGHTEANLRQSESLYRSVLEHSPMGVLHLDAVGNVTFENEQLRRIVGGPAGLSWVGQNVIAASGMDPKLAPLLGALLADGRSFSDRPVTIHLPDSTKVDLAGFGSPIRMADGQIVGAVLMFQDRTQQLAQERELAIRDRFRDAESALRGSAVVGTETDEYLEQASQILGASVAAEEMIILTYNVHDRSCRLGARWLAASFPDTLSNNEESTETERHPVGTVIPHIDEVALREVLSADESDEILWMPFHSAGDLGGFVVFRLNPNNSPLPIQQSQLLHLLDALIRTFETLWESVQVGSRYRLAVSTIDDGLFTYQLGDSGERRYMFVTPQFKAMLGVSVQRILATELPTTWFESGLDESGRRSLEEHYREIRSERPSTVTYSYTQPNGKLCWLREASTPHRSPGGALVVSGILSDVTDRQVAEQILIKSKEEALADARRKTSFLSTMSHELRTPLGTVNGFASMLSRELSELRPGVSVPAELTYFADAIETRSRELLDFVDDLLDLSNLESGLLTLQHGVVDVDAVVSHTIESILADGNYSSMNISVDVTEGLAVDGDSQRLERVLRKVIENAVKFSDPGAAIRVAASGNGRFVRIEVVDAGVGIDSRMLDEVANPFVQGDDRLNRNYEGKGIGLTVAKRLIEAMSGRFEITSQAGTGTTVVLYLPQTDRDKVTK